MARLSFSLARAAFAVACCRRSESDFSCSAFGLDGGFALVSDLSEREQPAAVRITRANSASESFFMVLDGPALLLPRESVGNEKQRRSKNYGCYF